MKKRVLSLLLAVTLASVSILTLAGCGDRSGDAPVADTTQETPDEPDDEPDVDNDDEPDVVAPEGGPTVTADYISFDDWTIEFTWLPMEGTDHVNPLAAAWNTDSAVDFVTRNPHVRINLAASMSADIGAAMAQTLTQAAMGTAPDVAPIDSFFMPHYYDFVQPITDILAENNIPLDSWFPFAQGIMAPDGPDGEIYAMWFRTDLRVLYYRRDLIDTPPTNVDEIFEIMEPLAEEGYMFIYTGGMGEATTMNMLPWFWSQGGEIFDAGGTPVFDEGNNADALINLFELIQRTIDTGITPARVNAIPTDIDMLEDIVGGQTAMFVGGSFLYPRIVEAIGQEEFDEIWGVAPIPVMPGGVQTSASGGWLYGVFSEDDEVRRYAAQFVIDLAISDEANVGYVEATGHLPARETSFALSEIWSNDPVFLQFREYLMFTHLRPSVALYTYWSTEFQAVFADIISGSLTPTEALQILSDAVWREYEATN